MNNRYLPMLIALLAGSIIDALLYINRDSPNAESCLLCIGSFAGIVLVLLPVLCLIFSLVGRFRENIRRDILPNVPSAMIVYLGTIMLGSSFCSNLIQQYWENWDISIFSLGLALLVFGLSFMSKK